MIGVYTRSALYPVKSPERLARELQAILDGQGDRVQVCSLNDVLKDPATREVFRRLFRRRESAGKAAADAVTPAPGRLFQSR
jgi:CelD/BcsL family acetyltransferase involved in cellulose biosynthesis